MSYATGNAAAGKLMSATRVACHGAEGVSPNDLWPNLAGQKQDYLIKQLKAFKDGSRSDPMMSPIAGLLSDVDIDNVTAYFSGLALGRSASAASPEADDAAAGKLMSATCVACHGAEGVSPNDLWPNLAGQKQDYLIKQLKAFKDGSRSDPMMSPIAGLLNDADIDNVTAYFSGLALVRSASSADRSGMVRIPAGKFWYGCKEQGDPDCDPDEQPGRSVDSPEFWIDRTEVTVEAYRSCVLAKACSAGGLSMPFWRDAEQPSWIWACNWKKEGRDQHPINCVDWKQAKTYCEWAGKRLPAEEEWERAARGADGWKYPWGNAGYGEAGRVANIADETLRSKRPRWPAAKGYDDGFYATAPVGSFPAGSSPEGALDMLGNVWEWTSSWSDPNHKYRVARGGSWSNAPRLARASNRYRFNPAYRGETFGFRCAQ